MTEVLATEIDIVINTEGGDSAKASLDAAAASAEKFNTIVKEQIRTLAGASVGYERLRQSHEAGVKSANDMDRALRGMQNALGVLKSDSAIASGVPQVIAGLREKLGGATFDKALNESHLASLKKYFQESSALVNAQTLERQRAADKATELDRADAEAFQKKASNERMRVRQLIAAGEEREAREADFAAKRAAKEEAEFRADLGRARAQAQRMIAQGEETALKEVAAQIQALDKGKAAWEKRVIDHKIMVEKRVKASEEAMLREAAAENQALERAKVAMEKRVIDHKIMVEKRIKASEEEAKREFDTIAASAYKEKEVWEQRLFRKQQLVEKNIKASEEAERRETDALRREVMGYNPLDSAMARRADRIDKLNRARASGLITDEKHAQTLAHLTKLYDAEQKSASAVLDVSVKRNYSHNQMLMLNAAAINSFQALAAGMDPVRVLVMESAQAFGALGMGGEGLKGVFTAMVSPLGLVVGGFGAMALAASVLAGRQLEMAQQQRTFNVQLRATGNEAGITASAIRSMASAAADATHSSRGQMFEAAGTALRGGRIRSNEDLQAVLRAAPDIAAVMRANGETTDSSLTPAVERLIGVMTGGWEAAKKLNSSLNFLTEKEYEAASGAAALGNSAGATKIALEALSRSSKGAAHEMESEWSRAFTAIGNAAGAMLDGLANKTQWMARALNTGAVAVSGLMAPDIASNTPAKADDITRGRENQRDALLRGLEKNSSQANTPYIEAVIRNISRLERELMDTSTSGAGGAVGVSSGGVGTTALGQTLTDRVNEYKRYSREVLSITDITQRELARIRLNARIEAEKLAGPPGMNPAERKAAENAIAEQAVTQATDEKRKVPQDRFRLMDIEAAGQERVAAATKMGARAAEEASIQAKADLEVARDSLIVREDLVKALRRQAEAQRELNKQQFIESEKLKAFVSSTQAAVILGDTAALEKMRAELEALQKVQAKVTPIAAQSLNSTPSMAGGDYRSSAINMLKRFEGFNGNAYPDAGDKGAYGYGSARKADGSPVRAGDTITEPDAVKLMEAEVDRAVQVVERVAKSFTGEVSDKLKAALVSFTYNLGEGGLTELTKNRKTQSDILAGMSLYNRYVRPGETEKRVSNVLTGRRAEEVASVTGAPVADVSALNQSTEATVKANQAAQVRLDYLKETLSIMEKFGRGEITQVQRDELLKTAQEALNNAVQNTNNSFKEAQELLGDSRAKATYKTAADAVDSLKLSMEQLREESKVRSSMFDQDKADRYISQLHEIKKISDLVGKDNPLVGQAEKYIKESEQISDSIAREKALYSDLSGFASSAFDRIGSSITDAFAKGEGAAINFGSIAKGILSELAQMAIKLAVVNPIKNMFGGNSPTLFDLGSKLAGSANGGQANGGMPSSGGMLDGLFNKITGGSGGVGGFMEAPLGYSSIESFASATEGVASLESLSGMTNGGALGGIAGLGMGAYQMANGNPIGGAAGILGAGISALGPLLGMSASFAGPIGMGVGLVGGLLGSLLGGEDKPGPPRSWADVSFQNGVFSSEGGSENGGDPGSFVQAGNSVFSELMGVGKTYGLGIKPFKMKMGENNINRPEDLMAHLLMQKVMSSFDPIMQTVIDNSTAMDVSGLTADLEIGKKYKNLKTIGDPVQYGDSSIRQLYEDFTGIKVRAGELGLSLAELKQAMDSKIGHDYAQSMKELRDPMQLAIDKLGEQREATLSMANTAGFATDAIEALYAERIKRATEDANQQISSTRAGLLARQAALKEDTLSQTRITIEASQAEERLRLGRQAGTDMALLAEVQAGELAKALEGAGGDLIGLTGLVEASFAKMKQYATSFKDWLLNDLIGNTSTLTGVDRLAEAQKALRETSLAAQAPGADFSALQPQVLNIATQVQNLADNLYQGTVIGAAVKGMTRTEILGLAKNVGLPGFADGGSFIVPPGFEGDTGIPFMKVSSGERVTVSRPGTNDNQAMGGLLAQMLTELRGMRESFQGLQEANSMLSARLGRVLVANGRAA